MTELSDYKRTVSDPLEASLRREIAALKAERHETIVAAAVRIPVSDEFRAQVWREQRVYPDYLTVSAPPPARHGSLLHPLHKDHRVRGIAAADQGFLTSTGRYVSREEALKIALASGQPMIDHPSRHPTQLFSEDLW